MVECSTPCWSIFYSSIVYMCKMAEEQSKTDFSHILSNIDRKFDIIHVRWTDSKFFEIKFRTQIPRDSEDFNALCDEWVDLFSDVTNTVWAKKISNTGPKIRFRKQYQCWTQGGKVIQKELLFDATRCKGTVDMKVLTDNPLTRRKNKHIKLGLNVVVKINFTHLHQVDTSQPFAFFVHLCPPQPEPPKPAIQPNERLPQLITELVQKGMKLSSKNINSNIVAIQTANERDSNKESKQNNTSMVIQNNQVSMMTEGLSHGLTTEDLLQKDILQSSMLHADLELKPIISDTDTLSDTHQQLLHDTLQLPNLQQQTIQLIQNVPLQNMEAVKLEIQPQLQQYTQVVNSPQIDLNEPLFMCQPLMFDSSQTIPVTGQLQLHLVQLQPQNIQQQSQFL